MLGVFRKLASLGLALWTLLAFSAGAEAGTIYVTQNGTGDKNGNSWEHALDESGFRERLKTARNGDVFWVAKGAYRPAENMYAYSESFVLEKGVALYGGFAGGEASLQERDVKANVTILTGDIESNDIRTGGVTLTTNGIQGNNSRCVVRAENCSDATVLDGFTISGGKQEAHSYTGGMLIQGGAPRVTNCTFAGNQGTKGAGMHIRKSTKGESQARITHCTFIGNSAQESYGAAYGGGLFIDNSSPSIVSCTFTENRADHGGGMVIEGGSPVVVNCTFAKNTAYDSAGRGGGLYIDDSSVTVVNCTFTENQSAPNFGGGIAIKNTSRATIRNSIVWSNKTEPEVNRESSSATLQNSLVKDGSGGSGAPSGDPGLASLADNGGPTQTIAIGENGAARDKGNLSGLSASIQELLNVDQRGLPRDASPDIGAYEFQAPPLPPAPVTFSVTVSCDVGGIVKHGGHVVASSDVSFDVDVASGSSVSFDIVANPGFVIGALADNGIVIAEAVGRNSYTYEHPGVMEEHVLVATFRATEPGPNPPASPDVPGPNPPASPDVPGPNPPASPDVPGPNPPTSTDAVPPSIPSSPQNWVLRMEDTETPGVVNVTLTTSFSTSRRLGVMRTDVRGFDSRSELTLLSGTGEVAAKAKTNASYRYRLNITGRTARSALQEAAITSIRYRYEGETTEYALRLPTEGIRLAGMREEQGSTKSGSGGCDSGLGIPVLLALAVFVIRRGR